MYCEIFKSSRKENTYLYVEKGLDFDELPESLLDILGKLSFVMELALTIETKLVAQEAKEVMDQIKGKGFYLQLPPKV